MKNRSTFTWSESRISELLNLWNVQKQSGDKIALVFGLTKNAIVGKLGRLRREGYNVRLGDVRTPKQVTDATRAFAFKREQVKRETAPPKPKKDSGWSEENTQELIRRWNDGESASMISKVLGVVRGGVSAKVDRLRKAGVEMRCGEAPKPRVGRYIPSFHNKPRAFQFQADPDAALPPPNITHLRNVYSQNRNTAAGLKAMAAAESSMTGEGISILEFNRGKCGNVTGGSSPQWLFCGEPTGDVRSAWCPKCRPMMLVSGKTVAEAIAAQ